jgi:phage terminase large subunit-like protein
MVTPNLNRSVTIAVLEKEFEEAKQSGEAEIRRWASQHLNIEIGSRCGRTAGAVRITGKAAPTLQ